jgi:hypothetical protein
MVVPKYLNCSTVSNDSLPICMYPFYPAFWSRDMTIYLVFSAFTSKPISLLAINKASVLKMVWRWYYTSYETFCYNGISRCSGLQALSERKSQIPQSTIEKCWIASALESGGRGGVSHGSGNCLLSRECCLSRAGRKVDCWHSLSQAVVMARRKSNFAHGRTECRTCV